MTLKPTARGLHPRGLRPRGYFAVLGPPPPVPTPTNPVVRDGDIYRAIVQILAGTRQFSAVAFAEPPESWGSGAQRKTLAVVIPGPGDESDGYCGYDGDEVLRKVSWSLEIRVRQDDPLERFRVADRLGAVARKAINGQCLAGATYNRLTRLGSDQPGRSVAPERVVVLKGTFTYSVDDPAGRDVAFT